MNILIIKLGALGDMMQAFPMFDALSRHFGPRLTLLTRPEYAELARKSGYFTNIIMDTRASFSHTMALMWHLRRQRFHTVIDLQHVDRTRIYRAGLVGTYQSWITWASDCAHQHPYYRFAHMCKHHRWPALEPHRLTHMAESLDEDTLTYIRQYSRYAVVVAGGSHAHQGKKRWPIESYAKICEWLYRTHQILPICVGGVGDQLDQLVEACPYALNLIGKTTIYQLMSLGMNATFCVGNDTGPMLILAASGCHSLTLFGGVTPPEKGGAWAWGPQHRTLFSEELSELSPDVVAEQLSEMLLVL